MKTRIVQVKPALGGIVRRHSFQNPPAFPLPVLNYTTPSAMNVWPVGPTNLRQRLARRAGLVKLCTTETGEQMPEIGQPRMLAIIPKPLGVGSGGSSTTTWNVCAFYFGAGEPDDVYAAAVEGTYTYAGTYSGYSYQKREDNAYYRWQTSATTYFIGATLGSATGNFFQTTDGIWYSLRNEGNVIVRCYPVTDATAAGYAYGAMTAFGANLFLTNQATPALESWPTGTLTSTSGRIAWALHYGDLYILDAGVLKVIEPWTPSIEEVTASEGEIPTDCDMLCRAFGRLFMAQTRGTGWYASRVDYEDPSRAVAFTDADMGELPGPSTAMIPWSDDWMLFGCDNSLSVLRGDPGAGGRMDTISRELGVICDDAWCFTPEGDVVFMDWSGMYVVPRGALMPQPLSREKLPSDLRNIDPATYNVNLQWDPQHDGILLSVLPLTGASEADPGEFWWLDWPTKGFWQLSFPVAKPPRWLESFAWSAGYDHVMLMACDDGYLRHFSNTATGDDTDAITGYVSHGPIRTGWDDWHDGMVKELVGTLGAGSADVTWNLFTASSAEACAQATTAAATGTWSAGRSRTARPRRRGGAFMLQLLGTGLWEFDAAHVVLAQIGRQRP
jgi:hypothetical protein